MDSSRTHRWTRGLPVLFALAALIAGAAPAQAEKVVWHYSVWGPPRAFTSGIEATKRVLEEAGGGDFELKIHYASAVSSPKQHLDGIKIGLLEAAMICPAYYPGKTPLLSIVDQAFLLPGDLPTNAKVLDAVLRHPAVEKELARRWNTKYLSVVLMPPFELMGNVPIRNTADMKGKRIRIPGGILRVLKIFDAVPVMVTAPETYTALDRGTIDIIGFPYSDSFGVFRLHEVSQFVTTGFALSGVVCFSGVSLDAWAAAPEAVKRSIEQARRETVTAMIDAYREADKIWIPIFRERLQFFDFPPEERDKLVAAARPIWEEVAREADARGLPGSEILAFTKAEIAKHSK